MPEHETTFEQLVKSLTENLTNDVEKAWSIFRWIGSQEIERGKRKSPTNGTPLWYSLNKDPGKYHEIMITMMRLMFY